MRFVKTWLANVGVDELKWPAESPDLNLTEHLWDKLKHSLHARPPHLISVLDLTNALVAE